MSLFNNPLNTSSTPAAATTSSLFGQPAASTATGGLFGQQQQQPQQSSNIFGQPAAANATNTNTQGTGTNLFGNLSTNQPAPSSNIFGASSQLQQQQQQSQPSTNLFGQPASGGAGSLFGNVGNAASTTQPATQTFPLFGQNNNNNQQQQQQPAQGANIFGQNTTTPSSGFGGLFGSSTNQQQQQQQPSTNIFGSSTAPTGSSSVFGQTQQQQQQTPSTIAPLFTRTTKFNDLPEEIKKKFEQIDSHIQGRVQISNELKQHKLGDEPQKGMEQIRSVHKDLVNSIANLREDIAAMRELRTKIDQAVQDTIAATRIMDAFKGPHGAQQSAWLKNYANFPLEFFTRVTDQLRERLQWFNVTIEQIERKLASEANHVSITPQAIAATLQAQHASFVTLASKTAASDAELQKLKNTYRQLWRARTGSARDPFNEVDRGALGGDEFGFEGIRVK